MLERRDYQTVYKVMKKEQRISRMVEMINHQVMELMPLVQPVPATLRRLLVSSHISFELLHMRGSARLRPNSQTAVRMKICASMWKNWSAL